METGIPPEWKEQWDELIKQLQDPFKLRMTTLGIVVAIGFMAIYRPMDAQVQVLRRDLKTAQQRQASIQQVENLRKRRLDLLENLPEHGTLNFWQEYFLAGIRDSGVDLRALESMPKKTKMGDLQVVYLDIEAEGSYDDLFKLLAWIEDNEWFTRVIRMRLKGKNGRIESKFTVAILVSQGKSHGA